MAGSTYCRPSPGSEAPDWIKHKVRDIPFNGSYIDNFSDLAVDVDGDGYIDVVRASARGAR